MLPPRRDGRSRRARTGDRRRDEFVDRQMGRTEWQAHRERRARPFLAVGGDGATVDADQYLTRASPIPLPSVDRERDDSMR